MKVWEETWVANRNMVDLGEPGCGPNLGSFNSDLDETDPMCDRNRANLAAAAPEMARLLLELEWGGSAWDYGGSKETCLTCSAMAGSKFSDGATMREPDQHETDCRWLALMKKAGVAS